MFYTKKNKVKISKKKRYFKAGNNRMIKQQIRLYFTVLFYTVSGQKKKKNKIK